MFEIATDLKRRHLRIGMRGYWDSDTMSRYERTVRSALGSLKAVGGCETLLIDLSEMPIQPKDIADRHESLLIVAHELHSIRVAVLAQSDLSRLQTNRVAAKASSPVFVDEKEALHWLFQPPSE